MTASSVLVFGILLALPLLALPAVLFGAPVDPGLGRAALIGGVVFVLLCGAGRRGDRSGTGRCWRSGGRRSRRATASCASGRR